MQHFSFRAAAPNLHVSPKWLFLPKLKLELMSAYHLNGIFGNSGANSNGTVHPGGKFSEKR